MNREVWRETPFAVRLLLSTSFMMNLGFYALIPYLTLHLTGSIGWTLAMAALVLSVRQFCQQGFAFLGGVVADFFGYKGTMVIGMGIRAVGFGMFAFCAEPWQFFVAAILSGLGGSLFDPAVSAAFAVHTPENVRKEVFAFRNVLGNIGVVGSQLVGTLLATVNFIYLSLFAGGVFAFMTVLVLFLLPPIAAKNTRYSVWQSMVHVVKDRQFILFTIILMGHHYLGMQIFLTIPRFVEDVTGDKFYVGIVLSTVSLSVILLQMQVTRWLEGYRQKLILIGVGTLVMGAGLFLLSFADSLWLILIDVFLYALGTMIAVPNMVEIVPHFAPKEMVGAYYGFNGYSIAIGGSLGQIAGGWVYDTSKQLALPWLPWSICLLIGLLVAWQLFQMETKASRLDKGRFPQKGRVV